MGPYPRLLCYKVFDFLCRTLLDPPTGEDAHRPGIISFTDQDLETQLANMLNTLGIETQVLQPAKGLEVSADILFLLSLTLHLYRIWLKQFQSRS